MCHWNYIAAQKCSSVRDENVKSWDAKFSWFRKTLRGNASIYAREKWIYNTT